MSAMDKPSVNPGPVKRVTVLQGEAHASRDPQVEFATVLGSCVATCLYDPIARVGGMNHFLLAEPPSHLSHLEFDEHYGLFLMELLINEMLKLGAAKSRLKARLYGGANMNSMLADIGSANATFARRFLQQEGIEQAFEDLEGVNARRVHFQPTTGRVRCRATASATIPKQKPVAPQQTDIGQVELF